MRKIYNVKNALLIGAFSVSSAFSQNLSEVLCNLNADYASVTALIPSMYTFAYDGGVTNISDGGGDMYDGGNYLNTNLLSSINYSDNAIVSSAGFGAGGQYFTRHLPGLFVMAADINGVTSFSISGNVGADGGGSFDGYTFTTSWNSQNYNVFVKRIYNAGDPSVNHVIIVPENVAVSHTYGSTTDDDAHSVSDLSASTRIYYFLISRSAGGYIDNTTITAITDQFLQSIVGGPAIVANASATTLCTGDDLTLFGSGGSGGYNWNLGVTDNVTFAPTAGVYDYIVTSTSGGGCNQSDTVTVTVNEAPVFTLSTSDEIAGNDGGVYITLTGGSFPITYDWDNDGTGDFDDSQNLIGVGAGMYTVVVMQGNGCSASASATVNSQVGIEENTTVVNIYPNPTADLLVLQTEGSFVYHLSDLSGRVILSGNAVSKEEISLSNFANGTYILTVNSAQGVHATQIVKQ